jgi:hypothetical protein
MRGPQTLPGNPLRGIMAGKFLQCAAQTAVADRFAALATLAQIARA